MTTRTPHPGVYLPPHHVDSAQTLLSELSRHHNAGVRHLSHHLLKQLGDPNLNEEDADDLCGLISAALLTGRPSETELRSLRTWIRAKQREGLQWT